MPKDFCSHAGWLGFFFFTLAGLSFLLGSVVEKRVHPGRPSGSHPAAVKDLSYAVDNRIVELNWTVQGRR